MADQLTTAFKLRLKSRIGVLTASELRDVEAVLRIQLNLKP